MSDLSVSRPERTRMSTQEEAGNDQPATGFDRFLGAIRLAIPLVQRLLPLLDGNVATAVSNFVSPQPKSVPAPPPLPPPVNLGPIVDSLAEVQAGHRELRAQVNQQSESLKRIEEQLALVSGAADHNALAQQEIASDLQTVGNLVEGLRISGRKANYFRVLVLILLVASIGANVLLFVYLRRNLP